MDPATSAHVREQIDLEYERFAASAAPPGGFESLPDIATGRYIDDTFFALEQEHIWSKSWLLALLFWPKSKDETCFEVLWHGRGKNTDPESDEWKQRIETFNVILGEDNENLPWIQRSIASGAIDGIPLSYQERRIYHFHEYVDRVIGVDRVPAHLRVEPRLRALEEDGAGNPVR